HRPRRRRRRPGRLTSSSAASGKVAALTPDAAASPPPPGRGRRPSAPSRSPRWSYTVSQVPARAPPRKQPQRGAVGRHRDAEQAHAGRAGAPDRDHEAAPVVPVDRGAGGQPATPWARSASYLVMLLVRTLFQGRGCTARG